MKSLTILLSESIYSNAYKKAEEHGVDVGHFCSGVLTDYFLSTNQQPCVPVNFHIFGGTTTSERKFDVASAFEGFPRLSIELAQRFTDEALKYGRSRAYRKRRGIGFDPNYVFIEYLMSRSGLGGIGLSFYGEPQRHSNPPAILAKGIPSYSRAKVCSQTDLDMILPHIRQSYELKFGAI